MPRSHLETATWASVCLVAAVPNAYKSPKIAAKATDDALYCWRAADGITIELRNGPFGSTHPGGGNFVYGDAHVEFVDESIEMSVYRNLSTIDEGKTTF